MGYSVGYLGKIRVLVQDIFFLYCRGLVPVLALKTREKELRLP